MKDPVIERVIPTSKDAGFSPKPRRKMRKDFRASFPPHGRFVRILRSPFFSASEQDADFFCFGSEGQ